MNITMQRGLFAHVRRQLDEIRMGGGKAFAPVLVSALEALMQSVDWLDDDVVADYVAAGDYWDERGPVVT